VDASHDAAGVIARFADGRQADGDFLIGADGIHSRVRSVIDPLARMPAYAGFGNAGGFAPAVIDEREPGTCRMFYYPSCFFGYVASPDGEICWFANPPYSREMSPEELRVITSAEWKRRLVEGFHLDSSPAREIIEHSYGKIIASNQYLMPRIDIWRNDRMLIIGDAAHAPASATGQGASLAVEDAVMLARCLRDSSTISGAFAAYEGLRRERVERVVMLGRKTNSTKPSAMRQDALSDDTISEIIARNSTAKYWKSQSWLFDYHIDWVEPKIAKEYMSHPTAGEVSNRSPQSVG
jgi:2-polyprenyl-6-methoxyphenol hydroxylase-like FAD-dependent oxidoreductase